MPSPSLAIETNDLNSRAGNFLSSERFDLGLYSTPKSRKGVVETLVGDRSISYDDTSKAGESNDIESGGAVLKDEAKLGTISGVFLPCLQNILVS